jgi:hypothetical protein
MNDTRPTAAAYLRFVAWVLGVAALTAAVGYLPTRRLGGPDAVPALVAGCVVGVLASLVGGLPVLFARRDPTPAERLNRMLFGLALRFGVAAGLGLAAALSGWFARDPLLLWVGISYLALLPVDTRFALKGF